MVIRLYISYIMDCTSLNGAPTDGDGANSPPGGMA